ncbi:MAG: hypothetical protein ACJ78Q_04050 [Chloroflexia bacterium]
MEATITVKGKVVGQRRPPFADWSIPVPPDLRGLGDNVTLRDLITRIVLHEVDAFRSRQEERRLTRILSREQIERGATAGKIEMGGSDLDQEVDPDRAVGAALRAFEDGFYFVFLDGAQQRSLDQTVLLGEDSAVTFVRLVPLAGG